MPEITKKLRLCAIGGSGWMGGAVLIPALNKGVIEERNLVVVNRSGQRHGFSAYPDVEVSTDVGESVSQCDAVLLSVRPGDFDCLCTGLSSGSRSGDKLDLSKHLVISFMAGITSQQIKESTGAKKIICCMPNAAAEISESFTPWLASAEVSAAEKKWVDNILQAAGKTCEVADEAAMAYFTALTGSSQGWMAYFADSMQSAAEANGMPADVAETAVRQILKGMGNLISAGKETPKQIVEKKIKYGGTTCAGLEKMIELEIGGKIAAALAASAKRAASDMSKE